jgi:hypothetical protein
MQQWPGQQVRPAQTPQQIPMGNPDPIVAPPPPSERRAEQNQQLQRERDLRSAEIESERLRIAQDQAERDRIVFEQEQSKTGAADVPRERLARIRTSLANLRRLDQLVSTSNMGTGSIVGQESFRAGEDYMGISGWLNQRSNDVSGSIEMVQGDLINQVRNEMQEQGAPIGVRGADTEKEASRLAASIANLAQTQDEKEFLVGVERAREYYIRRFAASYNALVESGEAPPPSEILDQLLNEGATVDELGQIAGALGLEANREDLEANVRSRDAGGPVTGFEPTDTPPNGGGNVMFEGIPLLEGDYSAKSLTTGFAQGYGDMVQGIGDAVGVFTDPFAGVIASALGYDASQMQSLGTVNREGIGLPQSPEGAGRTSREFASGALALGGASRMAASALAPSSTQSVMNFMGSTPVRDTAAGAAAGAGAYYGNELGGPVGSLAGALLGGVAGYKAANTLASSKSAPNALAQASARQGVDMLPADAGGAVSRAVTTGTRASPLSIGPVAKAAERQQGQFADAARAASARQGQVVDTEAAGGLVRQGAQEFINQTRARGERLYERAAKQAKGVRAIYPRKTVEAAKEALQRMQQNPAATDAELSGLQRFIQNIEGGVPIQGLRDARTRLSESVYDGSLRSSSEQAMWKGILSSVADDIDTGLRAAGRTEAAQTFKAADKLWSERIDVIDSVLQPIIGRDGQKGGEQILSTIESMARGQSGGNMRLSGVLAAIPKDQANNVRATIIDRLGRATPGQQSAAGDTYSAATFLTNWNKMTPQAKASIFPDAKIRGDLNDLALIAEGTKRGQAIANTSNTGIAVGAANVIGGGAAAAANPIAALLGAGSIYLTGKLMASPSFARLLARTSKMPPETANRTFLEQVSILATREPQLRNDLNALTNAINDNGRLAAEEQQQQ